MSFELKNVGATYQRLMTKIFKPLIGHIVEVYIDDIVVKRRTKGEHARHLEETFHLIKTYNMKLNSAKCAFGVSANKFLGFMVTQRGIEVNPDQIKAVMETFPPSSKKKLQRLTGHLAALERFIARFTNKLRPFFLTLKAVSMTERTSDCKQEFGEIKHYLT
ncbi:Retrovirus-related Pol polyprotein from transposon 17.6 [Vitis vinifera]|uniref:Retrovirus-related Pol polyprotein from transposon 17.6 n=1 Tax=Vitis vinifera TaxID=29760 RepID=A0A438HGB3_VITVI|nr:Retrovirus-related Pol polyprotein from transposon 17.6 [Vitis vinifera]